MTDKVVNTAKKEPKVFNEPQAFYYRCIKVKEPIAFKGKAVTIDKDFSVGEYGSISVVETGKTNWHDFVNQEKFKSQVGLDNVIANAIAMGIDPRNKPFESCPEDCHDFTQVPDTLNELRDQLAKYGDSKKNLAKVASSLGISTEELLKKAGEGTLETFIEGFVQANAAKNEGDKVNEHKE